jgi:TldD protein
MEFYKIAKDLLGKGATYLDARILEGKSELLGLENGKLSSSSISSPFAIGIRVLYNGSIGFASTNSPQKVSRTAELAFKNARLMARKKGEVKVEIEGGERKKYKIKRKLDPLEVDPEEKMRFLLEFDGLLKDRKVRSREIGLRSSRARFTFLDSQGGKIVGDEVSCSLRARIVVKEGKQIQQAIYRRGKTCGYELVEQFDVERVAMELKRRAVRLLKAKHSPAGRFPVVCDNVLTGVFFHEAVGHACEADSLLENASIFKGMIGKQVASKEVTLLDNPLIEEEFGYYLYDDEGVRAREKVLIERGILKGLLHSRVTAWKMGSFPNGNARAESPIFLPIPRMSNLVIKAEDYEFEELIEGIKFGIYAKGSLGGEVESTKGCFVFNAEEAFLIERGKLSNPLKGVTLSGSTLEILKRISAIGKDSRPCFLGGFCGKRNQVIGVGEVAPHIRIDEVVVGGRAR